ncbi:MAG: hypothetical protein ACK4SU_01545, partial [Dictyoglomus sp.]
VSYWIEFYDLMNFYLSLEGFYQDGHKGLNFIYKRNLTRDDNYALQLLWIDPDIFVGRFSFTKNIWKKFDLGISGNYWDKAYILEGSLSYNEFLNNKAYLNFNIIRLSDYYSKALLNQWNFRIGFSGLKADMYSLEWGLSKLFLVFPQSYLNLTAKMGYLGGNPTLEEMFNLSDFKSLKEDYIGKVKFSLFANWNLPLLKDQELKFFNLAILRRTEGNIFLEFGGVWDSLNTIDKNGLNLGLGFELVNKFITFFDIPVNWYIGYAFPLWQGTPNPNENGRFYSYLTLGF